MVSLVEGQAGLPVAGRAEVWLARDRFAKIGEGVGHAEMGGSRGLWRTGTVPPGDYALVVEAEGWRRRVVEGVHVAATGGPTQTRVALDRGASLTGYVRTHQGAPVEGARIRCAGVSGESAKDGTFTLTGLDEGDASLEVDGPHVLLSIATSVTLSSKAALEVHIHVEPAGAIAVVPRGGTSPRRSLAWTAVPAAGGEPRSQEMTSGRFGELRYPSPDLVLGSLAPGTWRLAITWDGLPLEPRTVTIAPLETLTVEVGPP